jgi:hypothetical protein
LNCHLQEGLDIMCSFHGCAKTFKVKSSFSSHLSWYHKNWDATQIAAVYVRDAVEQAPTNLVHGSDRDCLYQTMQEEEYVDDVDPGIVLKTCLFFLSVSKVYCPCLHYFRDCKWKENTTEHITWVYYEYDVSDYAQDLRFMTIFLLNLTTEVQVAFPIQAYATMEPKL